MSARDTIYSMLTGDAELMALLPGGISNGQEINESETPTAFHATTRELQPCGQLRMETTAPHGPYQDGARMFFVVFFYQRHGSTAIDAALERAFEILDGASMAGGWVIRHADDLHDLSDPALHANFCRGRFAAILRR